MGVTIVTYSDRYFGGVQALWREAFPDDQPWNAAETSIPAKLAIQPELFILAVDEGQLIGSAMAGYDGHRGWLYSVAVLAAHRRRGIGAALICEAERRLHLLGCAKINLQIRSPNAAAIEFYRRLGYEVEERVSMGKRTGRYADPKPS